MTAKRANGEGSIYEHRNGYAAYCWVNKPDGTRDRKYVYGKTKEDVHEKWVDLHYRAKREVIATKTPTLSQYLHYWLDEIIEPHRSPNTYANYEMFSRLYIIPGLGSKRLNKLSTVDTQKWINKIAQTCRCCFLKKDESRPEQKCCAVSNCCSDLPPARALSDIRNTLRAALSNAISQDLIHKNAASGVTLPSVRAKRNKPWSSDQARKFLESAHNDSDPLFAAYGIAVGLVDWWG